MATTKRAKRVRSTRTARPPAEILFDRHSAELRSTEMTKIRRLVTTLRRNPDATVVIRGHTLGRGDASYNRSLGQQRADAVAGELLRHGIGRRRIMAFSVGRKREYLALSPSQRRQRRRASLAIYWGTVTELQFPTLLMEVQLGQQNVRARRV